MPRVAILLETAAFQRYGLPIITVADYDIQREESAAGTWALSFPAHEDVAASIRTRHRVTVIEEGREKRLLTRGVITDRQYAVSADRTGILRLAGFTRLFGLGAESTHLGLEFDGTVNILDIAEALTGEHVDASRVSGYVDMKPKKTYYDTSKLDALLDVLKDCRLSIRESLTDDSYELVSWDARPDSGYRFVTVDRAGPDLLNAAEAGIGIIAGTPSIGYNGRELATRIVPSGVDFNGDPLTLELATTSAPYTVQSALNPDGSTYWYIEDAAATSNAELIEVHLERSDIKVPNDDAGDRVLCANALYTAAVSELLMRKTDVIAFSGDIANGSQIDSIPGDRVRIQFKGVAHGFNGVQDFWAFDKHFLINKRRDAASGNGIRGVAFTLTAPEVPLRIPSLPDVVPIPPPPIEPPDPPWPLDDFTYDPLDDISADEITDEALPALEDFALPAVPPGLLAPANPKNPYPQCCGSPTKETEDTPPVPPDIEDGEDPFLASRCRVPWEAVAVQTFLFVEKWGGIWANPGIGADSFNPKRDRGIVVLGSASADPVLVVSGAVPSLLLATDSQMPANFGGDGHHWWRIYFLEITDEVVDFTGSTGAFRDVTWLRASDDLPTIGAYGGVDLNFDSDLEYVADFGEATANVAVSQNSLRDDLVWMFVDEGYRSIDDLDFTKTFHHEDPTIHNHDYALINAEFVTFTPGGGAASATSWMQQDTKENGFVHGITMGFEAHAVATSFPGACRVVAFAASLRLRALCAQGLLA